MSILTTASILVGLSFFLLVMTSIMTVINMRKIRKLEEITKQ